MVFLIQKFPGGNSAGALLSTGLQRGTDSSTSLRFAQNDIRKQEVPPVCCHPERSAIGAKPKDPLLLNRALSVKTGCIFSAGHVNYKYKTAFRQCAGLLF